ncbi:MAG: PHP domain-containing protein, partial [Pseudomonadota bacterium]|nr:PHP domain-containing protein [Pseudomonadota bacterium]
MSGENTGFAELTAISNFSFLQGGAHPQEMVQRAAHLGYQAVGLADRNTLAGVVRGHVAAREAGIRFVPGARLVAQCDFEAVCYPRDRTAYAALSQCLTRGNRRAVKGRCLLQMEDIETLAKNSTQCWIVVPPASADDGFRENLVRLVKAGAATGGHVYLLLAPLYGADDGAHFDRLAALASWAGATLVAGFNPLYHDPARRRLQDVLTCIRHHCTLDTAGYRLAANAERHLRPLADVMRLFRAFPQAVANIQNILSACRFSLDDLVYQYPEDAFDQTLSPQQLLEKLVWEGARGRFSDTVPEKLEKLIRYELKLIGELSYAPYFLTVHDLVQFARRKRILCQGRGSAAN